MPLSSCRLPTAPSGSFMVSSLVSKTLTHFKFIFAGGVTHGSNVTLLHVALRCSRRLLLESLAFPRGGPRLPCPTAVDCLNSVLGILLETSAWPRFSGSMATAAGGPATVSHLSHVLRGAQNPRSCSAAFPPLESQDETRNSRGGLEHSKARNRTCIRKVFILSDFFPRLLRAKVANVLAPGTALRWGSNAW